MKKLKTALVLEGGGMRGAYTAGALTWLIDNKIEFDASYGISTGAVHLCNFLLKDKKNLKDFSCEYINAPKTIGFNTFLKTGRIVDYEELFKVAVKQGFNVNTLNSLKKKGKIGVYDLNKGETIYLDIQDININELKAACTLPIIGKVVKEKGRYIFDGGITEMIPINESIKDKNDVHLIITTKPIDYIRKKANPFVVFVMKLIYPRWKSVGNDYAIRHLNYVSQINTINELNNSKKALYCYPTKKSNVTRLGGSKQDLLDLFNLGYSDMEDRKKEIYKLLNI